MLMTANTKDGGPAQTTSLGVSNARVTSADATTATAITDAPTSGQKLVILDVLVSADTAMRVDLQCETTATVIASLFIPANGAVQWTPRGKVKLATADKKLMYKASVTGNVAATAIYFSEA